MFKGKTVKIVADTITLISACLIVLVLMIATFLVSVLQLRFIDFVDVLSKLLVPIIILIAGNLLERSYLQISQIDKLKIERLTNLSDELYRLQDISMSFLHEGSQLWMNENKKEYESFRASNNEIMREFGECYNNARTAFNRSRIFIDDSALLEKVERLMRSILVTKNALLHMKYSETQRNEEFNKYSANLEIIISGTLMREIEDDVKLLLQ